ncbi:FAD-dependent oxidoreductase [Cryobacterium ruanii]|uniref:ferredoxin--NADP(+) reductase n=1 Tax=Cryobacterium ruanii TaxID=1259197 RepID=A0A4R9AT39_9MICO|nr:FAD-dependent oxidoreductase [Cryobacterium ruanii]TFD68880.1 oxidoreductase [Cryobacterium ruanii]
MSAPVGNASAPAAHSIAIVGSGPAGCYVAHFLRKRWPTCEIVIFERLELPYGLVRYGVAPDHVGTKAVARQFDRLFEQGGVRFVGGFEIGAQFSVDQLRAAFTVVVLATGLSADRALDIPGPAANGPSVNTALAGIYGSGRLTRLINGHPDENVEGIVIGTRVAIIGQGNVAIDLVRMLLMSADELRGHGVAQDVVDALAADPVCHIDVVGRSCLNRAKFDSAMIRELAKIPDVRFMVDPDELPEADSDSDSGDAGKREAVVSLIKADSYSDSGRTVRFHFGWVPEGIDGTDSVEGVLLRSTDGSRPSVRLTANSVLTAIGFLESVDAPLRRHLYESVDTDLEIGRLAAGLYCVGWLRRGPQGTIPANRTDAKMVADAIGGAADAGEFPSGKPGFAGLPVLTSTSRMERS